MQQFFSKHLNKKTDEDSADAQTNNHDNSDHELQRGDSLNEDDLVDTKNNSVGRSNSQASANSNKKSKSPNPPNSNKHSQRNGNSLRLFVGDRIRFANRVGKVTSIGPKPDKTDIYVRIQLETHSNANDIHNDINSDKNGRAIWVPIHVVERVLEASNRYQFTIGDRVRLEKKNVDGTVRYVGPTHFEKGLWFGVELDQPLGKNNGSVKKQFYFQTNPNCGIFVHHKRLTSLNGNKENQTNEINNNKKKHSKLSQSTIKKASKKSDGHHSKNQKPNSKLANNSKNKKKIDNNNNHNNENDKNKNTKQYRIQFEDDGYDTGESTEVESASEYDSDTTLELSLEEKDENHQNNHLYKHNHDKMFDFSLEETEPPSPTPTPNDNINNTNNNNTDSKQSSSQLSNENELKLDTTSNENDNTNPINIKTNLLLLPSNNEQPI